VARHASALSLTCPRRTSTFIRVCSPFLCLHSYCSNAARCAESVVDAAGHPSPGPLRFCSVTIAASTRASCEATELSSGKDTANDGLFTAWPAFAFARRD
jgi:hypothetical protein